jgi:ribonuclease HI
VVRGWKRKGGPIENLELWQELFRAARLHRVQWTWVRGHRGHAKNEYANDLAVRAAREQISSNGVVTSGFGPWLEARRGKGQYLDYDPDVAFAVLEERVRAEEAFPLRDH